jgi:hypothetical protein
LLATNVENIHTKISINQKTLQALQVQKTYLIFSLSTQIHLNKKEGKVFPSLQLAGF